jgi:NDP-sugar pyrophosphorylase family protein
MIPVLITTSGTGSRLDQLTKNTNKSLVPVGDKYAICHIIDEYPEITEFIITLGYFGNYVRDFLELAYPEKIFQFVNVDKYEGPGSSLGYSLLKAKEYLQRPFIFHCCDTITAIPKNIFELSNNTLFVIKSDDYISYSSTNVKNDKVIKMNGKGCKENDYIYTGLCFIKDYSFFWNKLERLYLNDRYSSILSDIHAIDSMIQENIYFTYKVLDSYFDTGNLISYNKTCSEFKSKFNILAKPNESLCFLNNYVIKFVNDKELNRKRMIRGNHLYPYVPKIIGFKDNFLAMEFIEGKLLAEYKKYGEISNLLEFAQNNLWNQKNINEKYKECCINFYKNKTFERVKKIPFLDTEINTINGIHIGNLTSLLNSIDYNFISTTVFSKFHGDFILDNIIITNDSKFCLLDWRHEFDSELEYGDTYYDLAKLRHNIILNHSNILNDLYDVQYLNDEVNIDLKCNYILVKQLEEYNQFIGKYNYNLVKIKIITAIIWLNMAPLYEGKFREFLFYFGKFNLYLALQEVRP